MAEQQLPEDEIAEARGIFDLYDTDSSGSVDSKELIAMMKKVHVTISTKEADQLIKDLDTDANGQMNFEEFCQSLVKMKQQKEEQDAALLKIFESFDDDKNGHIDIDELRKAMEEAGTKIPQAELEQMIKETDQNGDGKVNYKEFVHMMS